MAAIGGYLKKIYRRYSQELILSLQERGFIDLRPSFLEILIYLTENEKPTIKDIGLACELKKQTMTSHLNELQERGYILRKTDEGDKRAQQVELTEYGLKFKLALHEIMEEYDEKYTKLVGSVELDRILHVLENFHGKVGETGKQISLI